MAESPTFPLPVRERPAAAPPTSIDSLPNELLSHIFTFLDAPAAPSEARLHDQPSTGVFGPGDDPDTRDPAGVLPSPLLRTLPLKSASMVSRRWHAISLPILFRHVVWSVDRWDLLLVEQAPDHVAAIPLLDFIRSHDLGPSVLTLTMVVADSLAGMYRLQAEDEIDRAQEPRRQQQRDEDEDDDDDGDGNGNGSSRHQESRRISLMTALRMVDNEPGLERSATYNEDNNWLWDAVFGLVDPLRFTMLASPRMLASLLSRMVFLGDAWSFGTPLHMLSLSRKARDAGARVGAAAAAAACGSRKGKEKEKESAHQQPEHQKQASSPSSAASKSAPSSSSKSSSSKPKHNLRRVPCRLFTMRPWTSLLLNEGSSARVYSAYEFYTKRPPSVLGALLGTEEFPNDEGLIPATVRSLSYVAVFPLSSHFGTLIRHLPPVDRLFVQIVPRGSDGDGDGNDALSSVLAQQQQQQQRPIDPQDLWIERNTAYSMVIRAMMDGRRRGSWRRLLEFESGDAADREAWELAVQYVRMAGRAWRVAGEGVFCRREDYDEGEDEGRDGDDDDDDDDEEEDGSVDDDDDDDDDDNESVVEIIEMHGGSSNGGAGPANQGGEQESDGEQDPSAGNSPFVSVL